MTAIFDVLLNTDDIVVLGPPPVIDVSLDLGSQGQRGSRYFVGSGNPNTSGVLPSGEEVLLGDLFINSSTASQYGWLYVYTQTPSGNTWSPAIKLQPSLYTRYVEASFGVTGIATLTIPLSEIVSDVTISDADRYVVQITPVHNNPIALSVNSKTISSSNLQIIVEAIEYSSTTWQPLNSTIDLAVTISVV